MKTRTFILLTSLVLTLSGCAAGHYQRGYAGYGTGYYDGYGSSTYYAPSTTYRYGTYYRPSLPSHHERFDRHYDYHQPRVEFDHHSERRSEWHGHREGGHESQRGSREHSFADRGRERQGENRENGERRHRDHDH